MRSLIILLSLLSGTACRAEGVTVGDMFRAVKPSDLVSAFLGHCVHNPGRLDKVEAAADALGYATTPEPFWTMLSPQAADALYHSWFVIEGEGAPFLLGISEGPFENELYQICAVSNPFLNADDVLESLKKFVQLDDQFADEVIAGQRTRTWIVPKVLRALLSRWVISQAWVIRV